MAMSAHGLERLVERDLLRMAPRPDLALPVGEELWDAGPRPFLSSYIRSSASLTTDAMSVVSGLTSAHPMLRPTVGGSRDWSRKSRKAALSSARM